jgi:hypothetical protein
MEEASEDGKESPNSAHANGINEHTSAKFFYIITAFVNALFSLDVSCLHTLPCGGFFSPLHLCETFGWSHVYLYAKTNGNGSVLGTTVLPLHGIDFLSPPNHFVPLTPTPCVLEYARTSSVVAV